MKQWMLAAALQGALCLISTGHAAGPELGTQLQVYHQCLGERSGPECTDRFYEPIFRTCQDPSADCLPDLSRGRPGGMSFRRCALGRSCYFVKGQDPHLELRIEAKEERAELRDPYELPYGESMEIELEVRLPSGESLTTRNGSIVVAQLHAKNGQSPSFALRLKKNGDLAVTVRHRTDPSMGPGPGAELIPYNNPSIGRWLSQDPIGLQAGDLNLYRYVKNRATLYTDPEGNVGWAGAIWGGIAGGYGGYIASEGKLSGAFTGALAGAAVGIFNPFGASAAGAAAGASFACFSGQIMGNGVNWYFREPLTGIDVGAIVGAGIGGLTVGGALATGGYATAAATSSWGRLAVSLTQGTVEAAGEVVGRQFGLSYSPSTVPEIIPEEKPEMPGGDYFDRVGASYADVA